MLGDDPSFLPDFDLTIDNLDLPFDDEQYSNLAITESFVSVNSRRTSNKSGRLQLEDDLNLGPLRSPSPAIRLADLLGERDDSAGVTPEQHGHSDLPQYQGLQEDLGLMLEDDGDQIMQDHVVAQDMPASVRSVSGGVLHNDDLGGFDDGYLDTVSMNMLWCETTNVIQMQIDEQGGRMASDAQENAATQSDQHRSVEQENVTAETVQAPLRPRRPAKKVVPLDPDTELSRQHLRSQQESYLENMQRDIAQKRSLSNRGFAVKYAASLMYGNPDMEKHPLSMFFGPQLISIVGKIDLGNTVTRTQSTPPSPEPARQVRTPQPILDDMPQDFQTDINFDEIEYGREQPTPLDDGHESALLPRHQSTVSRRHASSQAAKSMSIGGRRRFSSLLPHQSRLDTVSPLASRAHQASLGPNDTPALEWPAGDEMNTDDVEPAAQVNTQGTDSQWLRSALNDESMNFLTFVEDSIGQRHGLGDDDVADIHGSSIAFEELLPAGDHSYMVAAQAILHVLVLGTKGLLSAEQDVPFGSITIALT